VDTGFCDRCIDGAREMLELLLLYSIRGFAHRGDARGRTIAKARTWATALAIRVQLGFV
jgi:hypothetical protein